LKLPGGEICGNEKFQVTLVLKTKFRRLLRRERNAESELIKWVGLGRWRLL